MNDITELKRALTDRAAEVAEHLLPRGRRHGREWVAGSVAGEPGESLKVCVHGAKAGAWCDFADGSSDAAGDLIDLWRAVKRLPLPEALDDIRGWLGVERPRFEKSAKAWRRPDKPRCQAPKSDVFAYLTGERRLSEDAVRAYRVGEQGRTIVFPSLLPDGTLAFVKFLGIDRSPEGKKVTRVEAGCEPVLFGWQAIDRNAREIVITEGEIDALTAWDYGFPALSTPFGGGKGAKQAWIESEFERLAQFETIFLALDTDSEGETAAEEIANRLGRHRCRRVILPRKDFNECRKAGLAGDDIHAAFAVARTLDPPELRRAGEFTDEVLRLFWPAGEQEPGYRLPFAKIGDRLVFRPGELTIWTGPSGAGKSQVLSHALVAMGDQGARVCLASLEMAPRQSLKRMVKQAGNVDRPTEPFLRAVMDWIDAWCWVFALVGKVSVAKLLETFEYARARYGCDAFVIDGLMRLGIGSEDYEGQEKAVFEIVTWAVEKGVHVHLVAHARKADRVQGGPPELEDIKGASEIGSNAFNILGVWRNRKLEDEIKAAEAAGDGAKLRDLADKPPVLLNVAKQRNGDWEGKIGLWFDQSTYQYYSAHDDRHGHQFVPWTQRRDAAE